ncbi:hypothetical protein [Streptomyces sp. SID10815]|uniref:hypothetical protein n=1 Tax=Streptomyces sp. SID10815 TaxID=2706027 RepID=UPI0013CB6567|nr:hypothetical protein [Streptomyces sp. SID10815]NEA46853.1 hypothetical protein [Streptomyces sp. SID10815]
MPSNGEQPQTYYPTPMPPQYAQAPAPAYGQHVVPLPQDTVVYPPTAGMDGVVVVPGPAGQPVAYYTPPSAPAPQPLVSPLLVKAALVAFILGVGGVGLYFLVTALVALVQALVTLGLIALAGLGGFVLLKMFSTGSSRGGTNVHVQARGRAKVQVHTGRGHNRGRRR